MESEWETISEADGMVVQHHEFIRNTYIDEHSSNTSVTCFLQVWLCEWDNRFRKSFLFQAYIKLSTSKFYIHIQGVLIERRNLINHVYSTGKFSFLPMRWIRPPLMVNEFSPYIVLEWIVYFINYSLRIL